MSDHWQRKHDTGTDLSVAEGVAAVKTELGTTARALRHMGVDPTTLALAARAEIDRLNSGEQPAE